MMPKLLMLADPSPLVASTPNGIHKMKLQSGLLPAGQKSGDHCAARSTICLRAVSVIGLLSPPRLTDSTGLLWERKTIVCCVRGVVEINTIWHYPGLVGWATVIPSLP